MIICLIRAFRSVFLRRPLPAPSLQSAHLSSITTHTRILQQTPFIFPVKVIAEHKLLIRHEPSYCPHYFSTVPQHDQKAQQSQFPWPEHIRALFRLSETDQPTPEPTTPTTSSTTQGKFRMTPEQASQEQQASANAHQNFSAYG